MPVVYSQEQQHSMSAARTYWCHISQRLLRHIYGISFQL